MGRSLGLVLCVAGLSGCYFLVGTSGLQGDPEAPRETSDGGGDGGDTPVVSDGGGGIDSGGGIDGGDAAGASPCTAKHAFCDDFDTGDPNVATRWDDVQIDFGALEIDSTRSVSAPRSLKFVSAPKVGITESWIEKKVALSNHAARVELDLFVGTESGSFPELDPVGIQLDPPPSGYNFNGVYLLFREGEASVQAFGEGTSGSNYNMTKPLGSVARNQWHHIVVTVEAPAATAPKITFTIGMSTMMLTLPSSSATTVGVGLGAVYANGPGGSWSFNFDNVVVDTP